MQAGVGRCVSNSTRCRQDWSTWHGRDAYIHNHCLGYRHNFAIFCQLLNSNLFTHRMLSFKREASSETYGPGSIFHHISFWSTILQSFTFWSLNQKTPKIFYLLFSFIYFYLISPLQVTMKDWQPLCRVGCKCLIVCAGIDDLRILLLLDWYLGS